MIGIVDSNQKIVSNGLVLHLDAAQLRSYPRSGTTFTDLSGNGRNATLENGASFNTAVGGNIFLDGNDDQFTTTSSTITWSGATVELWILQRSFVVSRRYFASNYPTFNDTFRASQTTYSDGSGGIAWDVNTSFYESGDGGYTTLNNWEQLVTSFATPNVIFYRNAQGWRNMVTPASNGLPTSINRFIRIGANEFGGGGERINASYAIVRVYNRGLTAMEVLQNYNATCTRFGLSPITIPSGASIGWYGRRYVGYFNNNVSWFASATLHGDVLINVTRINKFSPGVIATYSYMWLGYFYARTTETYTFFTNSDDASYVWVGSNAISGYTTGNAIVNNPLGDKSGSLSLTAGTFYPIRIMFGNDAGAGQLSVSFSTPTISRTANGLGYFFNGTVDLFSAWP